MIDLRLTDEIEAGDIIYNPTEEVSYEVMSCKYDTDFKSKVVYLRPFPPLGTNKEEFSMPTQAMIDLKYKLTKQRKV